jgi:aspartate carbamoyltransferase catalytic subunit
VASSTAKNTSRNRQIEAPCAAGGRTQVNLFFEASTRTQSSFEIAGKRLGADVMNMAVATSALSKGETVLDTAMTINAMHPDFLVVRHPSSGAVELLAQKVSCSVINAGDGQHEHPTQALLDALTIRRRLGRIEGLTIAISRRRPAFAWSPVPTFTCSTVGARVRVVALTLLPSGIEEFRRRGSPQHGRRSRQCRCGDDAAPAARTHEWRLVPSSREYYRFFGLNEEAGM